MRAASDGGMEATHDQPITPIGLRPPPRPPPYVRRDRLLRLMDEAAAAPVVVVAAGAGTGKTTLVGAWVAEADKPTAWITLTERSWNVGEFWTLVVSALREFVSECGTQALDRLRHGGALADVVAELLDELGAQPRPASFLVIDDLHWTHDNAEISSSLALFVQYLPNWLHLIIVSRWEPQLPRDRLLGAGRLVEVHFSELRFSPAESREVLAHVNAALSSAEIDAIAKAADGWVAGLHLAAMAALMVTSRDPAEVAAPPEDATMSDYVLREVLAHEPSELVNALLEMAVVERVNGPLGEALTGRSDVREVLALAEQHGLFVSRVNPEGWYEMHPVVRVALLAELDARLPGRIRELHARAATWLEASGETVPALDHWLLADRPRNALRLLAMQQATLYDSGNEAVVKAVMERLSGVAMIDTLEAMIDFAWCHLLVDRRRFIDLVDQVSLLASTSTLTETEALQVQMIQSIAAMVGGRWTVGGALARAAVAQSPESAFHDPLGRFGWNVIAREIALSERWDDRDDEVRELALAASRDKARRLAFEGTRALGVAIAGRPHSALRIAEQLRSRPATAQMTILRAEVQTAEAIAHWELGDRDRALTEFHALSELAGEPTLIYRLIGYLGLASVYLTRGQVELAAAMVTKSEKAIHEEELGADIRDRLVRASFAVALSRGDTRTACDLARQINDSFWSAIDEARVDLAEHKSAEARAALSGAAPRCVRHEVVLALEQYRAADTREHAQRFASLAVTHAAGAGMVHTFAAAGSDLIEAAERGALHVPATWLAELRRTRTSSLPNGSSGLEPLTDRERDVLRFLPSRLTTREIADELHISINTLKYHLKTIYRKLGVASRADAADAARHMGHSISGG
jgi:LuxR family maltose regulon positive regulatory protein